LAALLGYVLLGGAPPEVEAVITTVDFLTASAISLA
jgi:hypothetical protein